MDEQRFRQICEGFTSRRLFYPCCGQDFLLPIVTFKEFVDDFWFVDIHPQPSRSLLLNQDYEYISNERFKLEGVTIRRHLPYEVRVHSERYQHKTSVKDLRVNTCKGRGYNAFRSALKIPGKKISVFFYRGDSMGEGGSDFWWLNNRILRHLLPEMEKPALIVTDGSNAMDKFRNFHSKSDISCEEAVEQSDAFEFHGHRFECIYGLEHRYGPTLVWAVEGQED